MINIKTATTILTAVTVAGVSVQKFVARRKTATTVAAIEEYATSEASDLDVKYVAFCKAQDELSDRMLSGYYDDKSDDEARHDYQILFAKYL